MNIYDEAKNEIINLPLICTCKQNKMWFSISESKNSIFEFFFSNSCWNKIKKKETESFQHTNSLFS